MPTVEERIERLERIILSSKVKLRKVISEEDAMIIYNVGKSRLKQLRRGFRNKGGEFIPPQLFKWSHVNGRNFEYDLEEMEAFFKREQA